VRSLDEHHHQSSIAPRIRTIDAASLWELLVAKALLARVHILHTSTNCKRECIPEKPVTRLSTKKKEQFSVLVCSLALCASIVSRVLVLGAGCLRVFHVRYVPRVAPRARSLFTLKAA
jgi:hypothetical protein